jgi:hypothetical protein
MRRAAGVAAAHGGPALVVAHGGVMRVWLSSITSRAIEPIRNGALYEITFKETVHAAPWPGGWPETSTDRG